MFFIFYRDTYYKMKTFYMYPSQNQNIEDFSERIINAFRELQEYLHEAYKVAFEGIAEIKQKYYDRFVSFGHIEDSFGIRSYLRLPHYYIDLQFRIKMSKNLGVTEETCLKMIKSGVTVPKVLRYYEKMIREFYKDFKNYMKIVEKREKFAKSGIYSKLNRLKLDNTSTCTTAVVRRKHN